LWQINGSFPITVSSVISDRQIGWQGGRQACKQTNRQTDTFRWPVTGRQLVRQARQVGRQTGGKTGKRVERQAGKQVDGQADRQAKETTTKDREKLHIIKYKKEIFAIDRMRTSALNG
jgi:hypothetical protein